MDLLDRKDPLLVIIDGQINIIVLPEDITKLIKYLVGVLIVHERVQTSL